MQSLVSSSVQIEDSYSRRASKGSVRSIVRSFASRHLAFDASSNQVARIASSGVVEAGCVDERRSRWPSFKGGGWARGSSVNDGSLTKKV